MVLRVECLAFVILVNALIVLAVCGSEIGEVVLGEANCSEQCEGESEMHFNYYRFDANLTLKSIPN